jgi:hypothetical protein
MLVAASRAAAAAAATLTQPIPVETPGEPRVEVAVVEPMSTWKAGRGRPAKFKGTPEQKAAAIEMAKTVAAARKAASDVLAANAKADADARVFACDKCDKKFAIRCLLESHSKVHSEEKPHACDEVRWCSFVLHFIYFSFFYVGHCFRFDFCTV